MVFNLLFLVQALRYEGETIRSSLLDLLNERATSNQQIASLLYWYLKTESEPIQSKETKVSKETEKNIRLYQHLFNCFLKHLRTNSSPVIDSLDKQIQLFEILKKIAKTVKEAKDKKVELRKRLQEVNWAQYNGIPYPMDVNVLLKEPVVEECTVFSSAMVPCKLTFHTMDESKFTFLFKSGDDLRQDQMVL
jgi:phosphatidylinositol 3-kinase